MSTTPTPDPSKPALVTADIVDAMRSIQNEGDRWRLADALAAQIPSGDDGFAEIIDQATAAGVAGNLSANTLRLYRDTSNRWPADKRIPAVSFSAHREVMVLDTMAKRTKMLADLSKNLGPGKVTVAAVRKAIAVQQGKTPAAPKNAQATSKVADVYADALAGFPTLIAGIVPSTSEADLDKIRAGLDKALAHVDRLRAKAARKATAEAKKATAAKTPARKPAPKPKASENGEGKPAPTTMARKRGAARQGDLRDL